MSYVDITIPFDEAENYFKPNNKEKLNRFFYKDKNYNKLLSDTTYYLIGEKGSGKTTYCAYFCNNTINNTVSKRYLLTVDDYNKILKMKKEGKLNYTHYLTLWKAILLTKLLSSIGQNEIALFNSKVYDEIKKTLAKYNFSKITMESFSPVSFMDNEKFAYGINGGLNSDISNLEASKSYENSTQTSSEKYVYEDNWLYFVNTIAAEIERLRLKNNHYLFIDGLDTRPVDIDYAEYKECIYPLVRAVYDLNNDIFSRIKDRNKGRLQIILLTRLDIFLEAGLSNAGSKISDNSAFLNWSISNQNDYKSSTIFALVNNMLRAGNEQGEKGWEYYFNFEVKRGNMEYESFNYFLRLTTSKPRDFVKLLKITKERCEQNNLDNPTPEIIESDLFQRSYSTYFVDSVRNALSFYYNDKDIKLLFEFIKSIRARTFTYREYNDKWNSYKDKEKLEQRFESSNDILALLFDFNMVAMQERSLQGAPYYRWKYREITIANYDYDLDINQIEDKTKFTFHWALEKEFGLYLN